MEPVLEAEVVVVVGVPPQGTAQQPVVFDFVGPPGGC